MKDHAAAIRQEFIRSVPREDSTASKLDRAKAYLGRNWVLHPDYQPNPKHSVFNRGVVAF